MKKTAETKENVEEFVRDYDFVFEIKTDEK